VVIIIINIIISVNLTFLLDVTAEALRAKIDRKSSMCNGVGQYSPDFHVEWDVPHQSFSYGEIGQWIPYNSVADSVHI